MAQRKGRPEKTERPIEAIMIELPRLSAVTSGMPFTHSEICIPAACVDQPTLLTVVTISAATL